LPYIPEAAWPSRETYF